MTDEQIAEIYALARESFVLRVAVDDLAQIDAVVEHGADAGGAPHATHALALAESVLPRGVRDVLGVEHLRRLLVAQTLGAHLEQPHDERRLGWVHLAAFGLRLTDVAVAEASAGRCDATNLLVAEIAGMWCERGCVRV